MVATSFLTWAGFGVIDAEGNAQATRGGDEFRGFLNGLWTAGSGAMAPGASSVQ